MEIILLTTIIWHFLRFKIDLIVWKYDSTGELGYIHQEFKIDLIVWKYMIINRPIFLIHGLK